MPPEQARGETDRISERADGFALGSILCEALTGSPAFTGRAATEILRKAADGATADAVARLDACGSEAELIALAKDCLAVEPEGRPRDANVVAERVTAYLAGVQERVQAAERERAVAVARAIEERRRRKLQVGLAASLLALTTAGGLGTTYYLQQRQAHAAAVEQVLTRRLPAARPGPGQRRRPGAVANRPGGDRPGRERLGRRRVGSGPARCPAGRGPGRCPGRRPRPPAARPLDRHPQRQGRRPRGLLDRRRLRRRLPRRGSGHRCPAAGRGGGADQGPTADRGDGPGLGPGRLGLRAARQERRQGRGQAALGDRRRRRPRRVAYGPAHGPEQADRAARSATLKGLVRDARFDELGPVSLDLLGSALDAAGDRAAAEAVLREAQRRHPDDVWVNYNLARVLEELGRTDEAVRYFTAARSIRPETAHELAHALENRGESDEAIEVFRQLCLIRARNGRHLSCFGRALQDRGRVEESGKVLDSAIAALREEIQLHPNHLNAHLSLGYALEAQGKLDEAIAECRTAIKLQPDFAMAHAIIGNALKSQGKLDAAIAEYRTAIKLKPDFAEAHISLGAMLCDQVHDYPAAEAAFRQAIRLKPNGAKAHKNLGNALKAQGKLDAAIAEYRTAIKLKPDFAEAHISLGAMLCDQVHDYPAAEAAFRQAIRLKPNLAVAHANLREALQAQGKLDEAIAECRTAIKLQPDFAEAHNDLGAILCDQVHDYPAAEAAFRQAIRLKPNGAKAHMNLGNALKAQGKLDAAIAEYRTAIKLKPDYAEAHDSLGNTLGESGDVRDAIAAFREAIRFKPDFAGADCNLGSALGTSGDVRGAIASFREAIRLKPDLAEAHCNLGLALGRQGRYAESLAELRLGHEIGSKRTDWRLPSARWVALAERLPAVLAGTAQPADAAQRLSFAQMAYDAKRYAAAARLWSDALAADPKLGDDRRAPHRYNAVCAAVLAAAGRAEGEPPPDAAAKAELRRKALDWLRAELAAGSKVLDSGEAKARAAVSPALRHWKQDPDLAGVRDVDALATLDDDERRAWEARWKNVDAILKSEARPGPAGSESRACY